MAQTARRRRLISHVASVFMNKYNLEYISVEDASNPADASISKRQWETSMGAWRIATRKRCEATLAAATGAAATSVVAATGAAATSGAVVASGVAASDQGVAMS